MTIALYAFMAFSAVFSVQHIAKGIRAFIISKKAGILKVWVTPLVIVQAVLCAFWIVIAANRFSMAADYRSKAAAYERIGSIGGTIDADGYQHVAVKTSDAQNRITEYVSKLYADADTMSTIAWYMLTLGIFEFTLIPNMIWYFTAEGVVLGKFKFPEPITAKFRDGKIDVYYKAQLANNKKIMTFKGTQKNTEVFGRFIEWENETPQSSDIGQTT